MVNTSPICPICRTEIQDSSQKQCIKCEWPFIDENLLGSSTYDLLINWAICNYNQIQEIEGKSSYIQSRLGNRLDRQGDAISNVEKEIEKIWAYVKLGSIENHEDTSTEINTNTTAEDNSSTKEMEEESSVLSDLLENIDPKTNESNNSALTIVTSNPARTDLTVVETIAFDYDCCLNEFITKYSAISANLTESSINYNVANEEILILEEISRGGNYWIFSIDNSIYLVPTNKYINQHSYSSMNMIFEGESYTSNYKKIKIVKPAVVIDLNTNPKSWQLQEKGDLLFS
jgi:hypothetical protein